MHGTSLHSRTGTRAVRSALARSTSVRLGWT